MVKREKDDSTEQKILAAAKKVFVSNGMAGARMQDIADEAGINKALLHYYFKNKEQLFQTIFSKVSVGVWQQITSIFDSDKSLFEKIESFCSLYIDKIIENPYIPLFVLYEMNQRPETFVKKLFHGSLPNPKSFVAQVIAEVKSGKIRPVEPVQLVMSMVSMCVFPFMGKPMFKTVLHLDESSFVQLMRERKKEIPRFIINSIKK
jgi:AcrR family transcriptional regulator